MIIAGTAVGAGMFSLPIAMSGIWFGWSVAVFLLTWFCMLLSGMMILEANLNYPVGSSFSTITRDLLGQGWNVVNGLSIASSSISSPMPISPAAARSSATPCPAASA